MKGLLFYCRSLRLICSSMHSAHCSNLAPSEASKRIGPTVPRPLCAPTFELGREKSSHISSCAVYWMGATSSIMNILLRELVPRKRGNSILSFNTDTTCRVGYPHDPGDVSRMLRMWGHLSCGPRRWGGGGQKSLRKIIIHLAAPCTPAATPGPPLPTGRQRLVKLVCETDIARVMAKTKNTCIP